MKLSRKLGIGICRKPTLSDAGFTMFELMGTVSILAVLAAVASPAINYYVLKARFSEVIRQTEPYKLGIEMCVSALDCFNFGGGGGGTIANVAFDYKGHIPASLGTNPGLYMASLSLTSAGVITAAAQTGVGGLSGQDYILTPTLNPSGNGAMKWVVSGSCLGSSSGPKLCSDIP